MQARAPYPVRYPVRRSALWARGCAVLGAVSGLCLAWWTASASIVDTREWWWRVAAWGVWLLACAGLVLQSRKPWQGTLVWDGQGWHLEPLGEPPCVLPVGVAVVLDFQNILWLRAAGQDGAARWLWLERRCEPVLWLELRRAVYSRAKAPSKEAPTDHPVA